ncbi:hypothetical protein K505DRAFT_334629 [Melanomma pulvis-pyrius CBS 109.77]|uniref:Uncharacterized protein n=1 Tax=Melanomma pulvis-pyrius CBS 109.77 TaxID=1314802 RepID=A0A6A6XNF5_9PLEO|nr:hypothetical protein K505DRAFT_334629 [Melanomma pulvis-pyrius CBS 109.77]
MAAVPMAAMSYLTAPFVQRVAMEIPEHARRSRDALMSFSRNIPRTTRLEFTTLRAFPFKRNTGMVLSELRALPPQKGRFANIELPKTKEWRQRQKSKPIHLRFWEVLAEPRFKFYVKEGRSYTIKTGVPGVWENVALAIQQRTVKDAAENEAAAAKAKAKAMVPKNSPRSPVKRARPVTPVTVARPVVPKLKRQTSRPPPR